MGLDEQELTKRLAFYEKKYGPYIEKRGLQNVKNLFRMPTGSDWFTLFLITMALFIAWAYKHDTQVCNETLENLAITACTVCNEQLKVQSYNNQTYTNYSNFSLITLNEAMNTQPNS